MSVSLVDSMGRSRTLYFSSELLLQSSLVFQMWLIVDKNCNWRNRNILCFTGVAIAIVVVVALDITTTFLAILGVLSQSEWRSQNTNANRFYLFFV